MFLCEVGGGLLGGVMPGGTMLGGAVLGGAVLGGAVLGGAGVLFACRLSQACHMAPAVPPSLTKWTSTVIPYC